MGDSGITRSDAAVALSNAELQLAPVEMHVDLARATKVPLAEITSLGGGLASVSEVFRTVTATTEIPANGLFTPVNSAGLPLSSTQLFQAHDGLGAVGTVIGPNNQLGGIARWQQVASQQLTQTVTMPINPATLAMAVAMAQVSRKLDAIADTQREMFQYLKLRDKAELFANMTALKRCAEGYRLNWDNDVWLQAAANEVMTIKRESDQSIEMLVAQIESAKSKGRLIETRGQIEKRLDGLLDNLQDYQIATHNYAFAALVEPMVYGNFGRDSLLSVESDIENRGHRYLEVYTSCYDEVEKNVDSSADSVVLGGVAAASRRLGGVVAKTRIGDHTMIDETLEGMGANILKSNDQRSDRLMARLREVRSPEVFAFRDATQAINGVYNVNSSVLFDAENIYLLPEEQS